MHASRILIFSLGLLWISAGCTNQQLRLSTNRQARTLTRTQYEQILDNLAMSCVDPSVLPSLVSLRTGSTQIGDTGALGFLGTAALQSPFGASPTISASRSIVDQWGNAPVVDDNELKVLRRAFRIVRGFPEVVLGVKEANDLGVDLCQQIGTNSDISVQDNMHQKAYDTITQEFINNYRNFRIESQIKPAFDDDVFGSFVGKQIIRFGDSYFKCSTLEGDFIAENPRKAIDPEREERFMLKTRSSDPEVISLPATGLAMEAVRRVNDIQETLEHINELGIGWYRVGCKRDVPKDAYYVGRAARPSRSCRHWSCDANCYVWVCQDGLPTLADFTLSVIKLSGTFKDVQITTSPSGVQFSPAFTK